MHKVRLAAVECSYTEVGRQLKKQFILGLNNNDMLVEIIWELIKTEGNKDMISQQVLTGPKRVEP